MKLLSVLPDWALWLLLSAFLSAVAGAGAWGGWHARGIAMAPQLAQAAADLQAARADVAQARQELAEQRAAIAQERELAAAAVLAEQQRASAALQEIVRHERTIRTLRRAVADSADRAAGELQRAAEEFARAEAPGSGEGSAFAIGGPPAAGSGLVLADMLGRCGSRLASLARWAENASAAGSACERAYDAVTAPAEAAAPEPAGPPEGP